MSEHRIFAKCAWRLIPFMMLVYLVNLLDRVNVGFAALTMNNDLGFTPSIYGFAAGVFFLGFFLFQVPFSVAIERLGARRSVFCIMTAWGAISISTAFVQSAESFYLLRFLLGVAEAGLFPGFILYLTYWFPEAYRARHTANFMLAIPLSNIVGGPLSSVILQAEGVAGLRGWQWLFVIEGLPACLLAFVVLKLLPDSPAHAAWLSSEEKLAIASRLYVEGGSRQHDLWQSLRDPRVLALGLVIFGILFGAYGTVFWLPQIVQAMGFSNVETGFVSAGPFVVGMAAMIFWSRSSDLKGERIWHVALPSLLAAAGFIAASLAQNALLVLVALTFATVGLTAFYGPFYSLPPSFLSGTALAGGTAFIYAIGTLGGFIGPFIIGVLKQQTGDYATAMAVLALGPLLSASIVLALGRTIPSRKVRLS